MLNYHRPVRFEEVDGANILFFARYVQFAHEAMEHFFSPLPGGYPALTMQRKIGFPAVDVHVRYQAPVRYGDTLRIETSVKRLGGRSTTLHYRMFRTSDDVLCCDLEHTVVVCDLERIASIDMPADVRAQLVAHLEDGDVTSVAPEASR